MSWGQWPYSYETMDSDFKALGHKNAVSGIVGFDRGQENVGEEAAAAKEVQSLRFSIFLSV